MTVQNNVARNQYTAIASQTVFNYTFEIAAASDIAVYQRAGSAAPDDAADILAYPADYSITGIGVNTGGTIVLVSGATAGDFISIQSIVPAERDTAFTPGGAILASALNTEFDNDMLIFQRVLTLLNKLTPRYPNSAYVQDFDVVLPILAAGQIWRMNTAGTHIEAIDAPAGGIATNQATYLTLTNETAALPNSINLAAAGSGLMVNNAGVGILARSLAGTANQLAIANPTGVGGNPTVSIVNDPIIPGVGGMGIPQGTTAQRAIPVTGIGLRYNLDLAAIEYYDGVTWIQLDDADLSIYLPLAGGTMSGVINMGNNKITNLATPTVSTDAATKAYADLMLPLTGGTMTGNISLGSGFRVTNALDPSAPQDYATKFYVDQTALNGTSVYAASTVNLTVTQAGSGAGATLTNAGVQATFSLDGVNPPAGSNVLIKNLAAAQNEGIYTVTDVGSGATNWVLTRATSYDTPTEINNTGLIVIQNGSTLAGTLWYNTATIVTVDTTAFSYNQFGGIYALKGANADITSMSALSGYLQAPLGIKDSSGNIVVTFATVASAVNYVQLINASAAAATVGIAAIGSSATVNMAVSSKNGDIKFQDTAVAAVTKYYNAGNTNYIGFQAGVLAGDTTFTWPVADGTNAALWSNGSGVLSLGTFANANITSMTGLTGALQAPTGIKSSAGLNLVTFTYQGSAVNYLDIQNTPTGSGPQLSAIGSDATVALNLGTKNSTVNLYNSTATGTAPALRYYNNNFTHFTGLKVADAAATDVTFILPSADGSANFVMKTDGSANLSMTNGSQIAGTATNDNASAGNIGEFISSTVTAAAPVSIGSGTSTNLTSISLTAGDWDVWGNISMRCTNTALTTVIGSINTVSGVSPNEEYYCGTDSVLCSYIGVTVPYRRMSLSATTTVYIIGVAVFSVGTSSMSGGIYARRAR